MKLIVGLGNPGSQYERTRHNAGFLGVDALLRRSKVEGSVRQRFGGEVTEIPMAGDRCVLLKPMRFMNCSGSSVSEALGFYKLNAASDLMVLVDDYSLPLGQIRIRAEGSAGGHNGLSDIQRALGGQVYPRLRIGIDPPPEGYDDPANWVLGKFTDEQFRDLGTALTRVCEAVECFVRDGVTDAMNRFNTRPKPKAEAPASAKSAAPSTTPTTPPTPRTPAPGVRP
jgi:PTH1 family peptidyl-tRNA hydrolase